MKDALYNLPKAIGKIRKLRLSSIEEVSDDLDGLRIEKLLHHQT